MIIHSDVFLKKKDAGLGNPMELASDPFSSLFVPFEPFRPDFHRLSSLFSEHFSVLRSNSLYIISFPGLPPT